MQHAQIGQLRGKPLGLFSSAKKLGIAGDKLRRTIDNHYLFSLQEKDKWRLLDGDVVKADAAGAKDFEINTVVYF